MRVLKKGFKGYLLKLPTPSKAKGHPKGSLGFLPKGVEWNLYPKENVKGYIVSYGVERVYYKVAHITPKDAKRWFKGCCLKNLKRKSGPKVQYFNP